MGFHGASDSVSVLFLPGFSYSSGLFEPNDMKYEIHRDPAQDPSLAEMTEVAVRMLSRNPKGFYLFVESGRFCLAERRRRKWMATHRSGC